ncbi:MAG: hypothetical protein K2X38_23970 [Gemmataceae bacterium]|nr:hypothetical protein [Gemmataceae bacterium]
MKIKTMTVSALALILMTLFIFAAYRVGYYRGSESAHAASKLHERSSDKSPIRPAQIYEILGQPHTLIGVAGLAVEFFNRTDVTIQLDLNRDEVIGIESSSDIGRPSGR